MEIVFLAKGHAKLGVCRTDKDGNVTEAQPATFTVAADGPCVAVGQLNAETMEQVGDTSLFGDYDVAGFLKNALELLAPSRRGNIPNFEAIIKAMQQDGVDMCDYCHACNCRDCIVAEWKG